MTKPTHCYVASPGKYPALPYNRDPALAIEQAISVLREIVKQEPRIRHFFACEAFIEHELAPALLELQATARHVRELECKLAAANERAERAEQIAINKDSDLDQMREAWQEGISMWKDRAEQRYRDGLLEAGAGKGDAAPGTGREQSRAVDVPSAQGDSQGSVDAAPEAAPVAFMFLVREDGKGRGREFAAIDYTAQEGETILSKKPLVYG